MSATTELSVDRGAEPSPRIILVGPRGGANVGAVARALKNMGGGRLVTVASAFDAAQARRMAVHGRDVLESRVEVTSLAEAVAGCALVVGTTARRGAYRVQAREIREVARELVAAEHDAGSQGSRPFAFVFGPEDRGLSNDEITQCHRLAYIPTGHEYSSLNLSQAVLICVYEVLLARAERAGDAAARRAVADCEREEMYAAADAADIERMFVDLEGSLVEIGFLGEEHPERVMASLRSLLSRSGLDERELRILRGLARQIRWYATGGREVAAEKRAKGLKLR